MFWLTFCVFCCSVLWTTHGKTQQPLSEYIKKYETLSYSTSALSKQHERHRRSTSPHSSPILLNFEADGRKFRLRLKRDTALFADNFQMDNSEIVFDRSKIVHGEVLGYANSKVHGFIHEGIFKGKMHVDKNEYHIEPADKYFNDKQPFHSVIYKSEDVDYPHAHGSSCGINGRSKRWMEDVLKSEIKEERQNNKFNHDDNEPVLNRYRRASSGVDPKKKSCQLYMQADHRFTQYVGQGNKEKALLIMSEHVQAINTIYPGIDFDGNGNSDQIEFVIARMLVNGSEEKKDASNPFSQDNIGVEKLLELNSLQKINEGYCLGYIFTYRDFNDGVLGLAWVGSSKDAGGICEKMRPFSDGEKTLNTGVVTFINYGKAVPQRVSEITFAHEVGHNFGSPHDTTSQCTPGGSNGNYIMFARATEGNKPNNRKFSPCSIDSIRPVLNAKAICEDKTCCFKESQAAICGNKVVEEGEQCDCGFVSDQSCKDDKCCDGKMEGKEEGGCKLTSGSTCSPSEGLCCDAKTCQPIAGNNTFLCQNDTDCRTVSYCNGINASCPIAPPKMDLTPCFEGRKLCENGSCSASLCKIKSGYTECQCSEEGKMCDLCCEHTDKDNKKVCQSTAVINNITTMKQLPSAACDNFNGYCDVFLKCRKVDADGPLNRLRKKFFSKEAIMGYIAWIKLYWWACVLIGVGVILLMALFIKLCSVHTPSSNPNKPPARQLTLRRREQEQRRVQQERNQRARQQASEGYAGPSYANEPPPPYNPGSYEMRGGKR